MVTYDRNFDLYLSCMVLPVVNLNYSIRFTVIYYTYTQLIKTVISTYVIPLEHCEHDCSRPTALSSLLSVRLLQAKR